MFGYEDEGTVWLCCRMTDGTVRSLSGVTGSVVDGKAAFEFSPSPLPDDVTSAEEVDLEFLDGDQPSLQTINWDTVVSDFSIVDGHAQYYIRIYADGVLLNKPRDIGPGFTTPYLLDLN